MYVFSVHVSVNMHIYVCKYLYMCVYMYLSMYVRVYVLSVLGTELCLLFDILMN